MSVFRFLLNDSVVDENWQLVAGTGTNDRARYPVHFHRNGAVATGTPRIAIIIDDLGYGLNAGRRAIDLPGPVSFAVLPGTPRARVLANQAFATRVLYDVVERFCEA